MPDSGAARRRARARFLVVAAAVVLAGVAGYLGFTLVVPRRGAIAGTLVLASVTGFAAFFSPCSFPLMLTFLVRRSAVAARSLIGSVGMVAAGATTFLAVVAATAALSGGWLGRVVNFGSPAGRVLRLLVAGFLLLLGARQAGLIGLRAGWLDRVASLADRMLHRTRPQGVGRDFVYGFGYLLAGFG